MFPCFSIRSSCRALGLACTWAIAITASQADDAGTVPISNDFVSWSWISDQGLPHNVVSRVQQDRDGYLWLATMAGLTRFDGREFKVFLPTERPATGGRNVRDLAVLDDGTVLFLPASGGVWQVNGHAVSEHPVSREIRDVTLRELYVEPQGAIWLGTSQEIIRWERGSMERFGPEQGINRRMLQFSWATDAKQRTWIAGADFLGYYHEGKLRQVNEQTGVVYRVAPARDGGIWAFGLELLKWENETLIAVANAPWATQQASARCLFEDQTGALWVGTSRAGVFRFAQGRFESVPEVEPTIQHVTEDREGSIWLATDGGGIRRLRNRVFSLVDIPASGVGGDASGDIWLAAGINGLVRCRDESQEMFPYQASRRLLHVSTVCADRQGGLWLGSPLGVFRTTVDDPKNLKRIDTTLRNVRMISCASNGDVWVASGNVLGTFRDGKFTIVTDALGSGNDVTAIAEEPAGRLWFGTSQGGLFEFSDGAFARSSVLAGVEAAPIHAVLPEPSGALWLATTEGLVLVDKGVARVFTQADGLPDDIILQLLADDRGNLWLGTPRGLFRAARADFLARAAGLAARIHTVEYGPEQGLLGISPTTNHQPSAWKDLRGDLWFCTYKGTVRVHPARLPQDAPLPPVLIDAVRLGERTLDQRGSLRLPPGDHQLEFHFAVPSFAAPRQVRVRHRLEGLDTAWVDTAPDRTARYARLPPGGYNLRVIACNSEGVWNHAGTALAFTVLPAWWQTIWFRAGSVLGFALFVGWCVRFWSQRKLRTQLERLEREHALEKERARIARDMHDELGGCVTGINLVVQRLRNEQPPRANGSIELLDRRVRRLTSELDRVVWTVSPKNSSLDQLAEFVERFALSLCAETGVRCRVHGREKMPAVLIAPDCQHHVLAVLKESINNMLKHARATRVDVTMHHHRGTFSLSVRDDGIGFTPEAHEHSERNGLRNMRSRLADLGGMIAIRSAPGAGAEVLLEVPLRAATGRA